MLQSLARRARSFREVIPIYIAHLSLLNFRNYPRLELDLGPGMVLIQGDNGQGKSNLLEAIYILAIAKSPRASADRELVLRQDPQDDTHCQVSAVVGDDPRLRVQIDFRVTAPSAAQSSDQNGEAFESKGTAPASVQKLIRVNGVPRRASDLVGQINAVMFSAEDMELVSGSPSVRRRYLDILISQIDPRYLKALQRYQRIVYQRNHLLKTVRERGSGLDELEFWNDELASKGKYIMAQRFLTVRRLSELAGPIHRDLTGDLEGLDIIYQPATSLGLGGSEDEIAQGLREALEAQRQREVAQGVTVAGPHRDDLRLEIDGMDAGVYASRGQSRTVVLAMKLAEAQYLLGQRGREPILLLDDVLSELDAARRSHLLDRASLFRQCFITTADTDIIEERYISRMTRYVVRRGSVEPLEVPVDAGGP